MIAFLNGVLAARRPSSIYLDVNGVGFEVLMPQTSIAALPEIGSQVQVMTYLQVREDGMSLFGFLSLEEKALFEELIGVSGIGPKLALAALSFYSPSELVAAIAAQDVTRISKIPGVGKKMAQRIILELKGVIDGGMDGLLGDASSGASDTGTSSQSSALKGITDALLSMGFTSAEAELALSGAPEGASESTILQYALKRLGSQV
ncbi:MAG: Holliday junction branch migration protein RuvA [Eggerthellaceae bacterium]|nr:Holliday junction branch migration protein RuvA [Eggerthellaceae bacterium]